MKRLRYLFILALALIGLPFWRWLDLSVIVWPNPYFFSFLFTLLSLLFICWPVKLFRPRWQWRWILLLLFSLTGLSFLSGPLSSMATTDPKAAHCGKLTYTGFFYALHPYLNSAHQDDLEARNQLCWVRKMISRVPSRLESNIEVETYLKITQAKLMKPENKFRVSLPLVLFLWGKILYAIEGLQTSFLIADGLKLWSEQYSLEISERQYHWYEWPYSEIIKFEYGIIEKNWQKIQIEFNEN
jgi:hypothetical protein